MKKVPRSSKKGYPKKSVDSRKAMAQDAEKFFFSKIKGKHKIKPETDTRKRQRWQKRETHINRPFKIYSTVLCGGEVQKYQTHSLDLNLNSTAY